MRPFKRCLVAFAALGAVLATAGNAQAQMLAGLPEGLAFTFTPGATQHQFDDKRMLDDATGYQVGIGVEFNAMWTAEVVYGDVSADGDTGGADTDLTRWQIDGIRTLWAGGFPLDPYVVVGMGRQKFESDAGAEREIVGHYGLGVKYILTENLSLRADVRDYDSTYTEDDDIVGFLGVGFRLPVGQQQEQAPQRRTGPDDSDGDGVVDPQDACPGTPRGVAVNSRGCPLDGDNDGVPNYKDQCPRTPEGAKVDEQGCQIILREEVSIRMNVLFEVNDDTVRRGFYDEIRKVADFLDQYPGTTATIEGHTDSTGSADYNKQLSQARAEAVRQVLIDEFDIEPERLEAVGHGEDRPVADNDTAEGRERNRRVVAVIRATDERALERDNAS